MTSQQTSAGRYIRLGFYLVLAAIILAGGYASWIRFAKGLGASTHLSDAVPWGLWVWFDLSLVPLSAGGFIFCALFFIFNFERFQPLVRPAVLTAFTGYSVVVIALIYDLGLPHRFWHPLVMWNYHSAMFEVAWCIALYLSVLGLEMSIPAAEGTRWPKTAGFLKKFCAAFALVGAVLSILHQSSLGTLFLLTPEKLSPLWYSSWLPILFLASSLAGGTGFLILELLLAEKFLKAKFPEALIRSLGKMMAAALFVYLLLVLADFTRAGKWHLLASDSKGITSFAAEIFLGVILPLALLFFRKTRATRTGLSLVSILSVTGVILNRLNVTLVGFLLQNKAHYFPSWQEIAITLMLTGFGLVLFVFVSRRLPIFQEESV